MESGSNKPRETYNLLSQVTANTNITCYINIALCIYNERINEVSKF